MNRSPKRIAAIGAAAMVLALAASACTAAAPKPTVIYRYLTPSAATDTPSLFDTPSPADVPTDVPTAAAPTPVVSIAPTPTPSPSPTPIGNGCSGSADTKAFFVSEAKILRFAVYCGHVPAGWIFKAASDHLLKTLTATYTGKSSAKIVIQEGAFCTSGASACSPHDTSLGSAKFGNLDGGLYTLGPGPGYAIYVNPGTTSGYTATGTNVTQATFVNIVAALILVPKS